MDNLPSISQMYSSLAEHNILGTVRQYQSPKQPKPIPKKPTKRGNFLDDEIKQKVSPGPANKSNLQSKWGCKKSTAKYPDRRTFIAQLQQEDKKKNSPSPSSYDLKMDWPKLTKKQHVESEKINFINSTEYEANQKPGVGNYIVATNVGKKNIKEYKHTEHKPIQDTTLPRPNMNTYDPIPYNTFRYTEKMPPIKNRQQKTEVRKANKENKHPGPGQYDVENNWIGKKGGKKEKARFDKIHKGSAPNIYY